MELRSANADDATAIADIWHRGWADGHKGNVPEGLYEHRQEGHFLALTSSRIASSSVAVVDHRVVGFVTVRVDEIEEMYVDASERGTGVAAALLALGESIIAQGYDLAWLAVVEGNARARRFYERCGWTNAGSSVYLAETSTGTFESPILRYEKRVR
jgi:GNAT superfamily N-acetyltransferase